VSTKNSKKRWKCTKCKNSDRVACKHLERLLPKETGESIFAARYSNIENYPENADLQDVYDAEIKFRFILKKYGLDEIRIDILVLRTVYNWSLSEIAEELSIPHSETVRRLELQTYDLLRERKYKLEPVDE
jgi:hypothetical protein